MPRSDADADALDLRRVDHLVVATPNLVDTVSQFEERWGVAFQPGGRHPAWGTRNAVLPLLPTTYLEVIGPDLEAEHPAPPTLFGIDQLRAPSLVTWAIKATGLSALAELAGERGLPIGAVAPGRRIRPDGSALEWALSDPRRVEPDSLVPFLIEWVGPEHPADRWNGSVELLELSGEHPDPSGRLRALGTLDLRPRIVRGESPRLLARLRVPRGEVVLTR